MQGRVVTLAVVVASLIAVTSSAAATAPIQAAADPMCTTVTWIGVGPKALVPSLNRINVHCTLRRGDLNNFGVVALQNTLVKCYGQDIAVDGDFGRATERALIMAQTWEHHANGKTWLDIDGVYGHDTFLAISWPYHENADLNLKFRCLY